MPSPNIQFYQIPSGIRTPGFYFEFNTLLAVNSLPQNVYSVMIIAPMLASGTAAPNTPTQVFSDAQAAAYFGNGSIAHRMARAALTANSALMLWITGVMDASSGNPLAAAGTVTISGAPTNSGVLTLMVDNDMLQVGISLTDTPTTITANLAAVLLTRPDLPVSYVTGSGGLTTFTAKNKGTVGNQIQLSASVTAPGVGVAVVAMTGGAVDPETNYAAALAAAFPGSYSIYVVPWIDETNLQTLRTQVEAVSAYNQQRGAIGVGAFTGSLAGSTTLAGEINDGRMNLPYFPGTPSAAFELAAAYASVMASSTDPAMPLNTLQLNGIGIPPLAAQLTPTEIESLLWNGVTPIVVDSQQLPAIVRAVSTYTTNSSGIADPSLLDITTIRTLDYVRLACRTMMALRFPRAKLTPDMPAKVRSALYATLKQLEALEEVQNVDANYPGLLVEQDSQTVTQLDAKIPAAVVPGLDVFAARIDLLLQVGVSTS